MTITAKEGYKRTRVRYHGYGCIAFANCHCEASKAILAARANRSAEPTPKPPKQHGPSRWHRDSDRWPGKP